MPSEQPLDGQRLVVVTRCAEHHLDIAFDFAVRLFQAAGIHAQTACDRRTDLSRIQPLAFDFTRLDNILR